MLEAQAQIVVHPYLRPRTMISRNRYTNSSDGLVEGLAHTGIDRNPSSELLNIRGFQS
jgi:hypothetical protein